MAHKILVIDDDPNALRLVSYALQAEGYEVAVAASGAEALARLTSEHPDLVILDVMMPDMSGLEVCQRIRANRATARLPVLMLSARGLVADRVTGLRSGADDYLPKPADTNELIARVEALLSRASHTQATPSRARVLAFLGAKGGVGTTTVAVNIGVQIAELGKAVTLVELRPGAASVPTMLKLQPVHDLRELLAKTPSELAALDIRNRSLTRHSSGLRILAAPRSGDTACDISAGLVDALITQLLQDADYVLLDLPATWSAANQAAARLSRFTAVICEADVLSVPSATATLTTLQHWGIMGDMVGVILVNKGITSPPLAVQTIRTTLPAGLVGVLPPAADLAMMGVREGAPFSTLQPQHVASMALKELATRLTQDRVRPLPQ